MPGPYTGTPKGLFFYGSVLGAAWQGATTAEVWDSMRTAATYTAAFINGISTAAALGNPLVMAQALALLSGVTIQDVNSMRAIAGQNIAASRALAGAAPEMAVDSSMIGIPPALGTGPGTGLPQKQSLHVHWNGLDEEGNPVDGWYTIYDVDVSCTVGDLRALAETDANERIATRTKTPQAASITNVDRIDLLFT
jgi:hypothetical protein